MYRPLTRFLFRAPLLPIAALPRAARALRAHPLGDAAIAVASPTLAQAKPGAAREAALARYARRAAFRPTPSGLLAGVGVGLLGPRTAFATGTPTPYLAPSWARVDAAARALLEVPEVRDRVRLRAAPSVRLRDGLVRWTGPGDPFDEPQEAEVDPRLADILAAAASFAAWPTVRAHARGPDDEDGDLDDLLLALIDAGLLQTDLAPPLVGPPPAEHLRDRLAAIARPAETRNLDAAAAAFAAGDLEAGRAAWAALPGEAPRDVHAILIHRPRRPPRLDRTAVVRAAELVPVLVRLQEALAPPAAERLASRAWSDGLDAATELFGAGAFDLGPLADGDYGLDVASEDDDAAATVAPAPPPALLVLLTDAIAGAARARRREAHLDRDALEAALAGLAGTPLPATAELFLTPAPRSPGAPAGTGWLLGLHAPAGASVGRFLHALGTPLGEACAALAEAERRARPNEERVDVGFAPSAALADLCAHPPVRGRTLALGRWSAAGGDLVADELSLAADPGVPDALALYPRRSTDETQAIVPAPLQRVRSATASAGAPRLLVGWSLYRQHAPWAFTPGPLAELAFLPRLIVDGFVIAPASWQVPPHLRQGRRAPAGALARWRREMGVPRAVQVGEGDELYPLDLGARGAAAEVAGHARVFEIWPPLEAVVDRDGRRIEVVVPVVDDVSPPRPPRPVRVAPPRENGPLPGWRTFKLFGPAAFQDGLLVEMIVPLLVDARRAGELDAWFFIRYLDGPGMRPHLRLRAQAPDGDLGPFERRLRAAFEGARAAGALAVLETADYFPERGRFRPDELAAVHALFESDSEAAAAALGDPDHARIPALAESCDALCRGLGLDLAARHGIARARRQAADGFTGVDAETRRASDAAFRAHGRALRGALIAPPLFLDRHQARVATAAASLTDAARVRLLPTLLHLAAVRLVGPDPDAERLGYTFWERALEGLRRTK